jgi:hypothetical protein
MSHPTLASALALLAAILAWRYSRAVSLGLAWSLACAAVLLLPHAAWELRGGTWHLTPFEVGVRVIASIGTGAVGLGALVARGRYRTRRTQAPRAVVGNANTLLAFRAAMRIGRPDTLAALLVGSAFADGFAAWWWSKTGDWGPFPWASCVALVAMIVVAAWPQRCAAGVEPTWYPPVPPR